MAIEPRVREAHQTVFVDTFTDGVLGPDVAMLGPVADGGHVVWNSTPGCWGTMIAPAIRGGHVVQVTFRAPVDRLEACGLLGYATEQYGAR